ncbi:MAG: hypothetical protein M3321_10970 [Actinomycetota bacterium]|nr:hypothetical protein [Actinomycetota bacterium]
MPTNINNAGRVALALAFVVAGLAGLAYAGGVGSAASAGPASAEQYGGRVIVCHRTGSRRNPFRTISVSRNALAAHLRHGDTTGPCSTRLNASVSRSAVLTTTTGRRVRTIRRGSYWVVVTDATRAAGFRLLGPRVNRSTSVRFRGTVRWRVRFVRGTYRYSGVGARGGGTFRVR